MIIQSYAAAAVTMTEVVQVLRDRGFPLCFEQLTVDPRQSRRLADGRIEYQQTNFDINFNEGPITAALDTVIRADPDYSWEQLGQRPTYVIFPVASSALEWTVPSSHGTGQDWIEAITTLPLDDHHITIFPRGVDRQPDHTLAEAPDETAARRWLTAVVDQVGRGRYWNLAGLGEQRTLVIGQIAPPLIPPTINLAPIPFW